MCLCPSCKVTDAYHDKGFATWPRGEPAGQHSSEAAYKAHVAYVWKGVRKTTHAVNPFPCTGTPYMDPHAHYKFEGSEYYVGHTKKYRHYPETTAAYVALFVKLHGYVTEEKLAEREDYARMVEREEQANRRNQLRRAA